jgi:hypothetical protein
MRAGSKLHNGFEVPTNVVIHKSKTDREFYISSIYGDKGKIKYLGGEFKEFDLMHIKKYL